MTTESPRRIHRRVFAAWLMGRRRQERAASNAVDPAADPAAVPAAAQVQAPETGETEILGAFSMSPADALPAGMAVLTVIPSEQEQGAPRFLLRGFCWCCDAMHFPGTYDRPGLALDGLMSDSGEPPAAILSLMKSWSSTKSELSEWLGRHRDMRQLVIWDVTGYPIPWELFWLEHPPEWKPGHRTGWKFEHRAGCKGHWLGGLITVTRWLQIRTTSCGAVRDYRSAYHCAGPVLSHIDPRFSSDHLLLTGFRALSTASVRELVNALDADGDALSLVYVACEGEFGEQISECRLGDLPLVHFDSQWLSRLAGAATFVFLNACHSGGLGYDRKRLNDGFLRGFAEVFLRSGAAGVLATTGRVGDSAAFEMARAVLQRLRDQPDQPVAEIVRDLRAEAASLIPADLSRVDNPEAQKKLLPLLYRSMYVYYGSPRATVSPDLDGGNS